MNKFKYYNNVFVFYWVKGRGQQVKSGFVWFRGISVELGNRSWRRGVVASPGQMTTQKGPNDDSKGE